MLVGRDAERADFLDLIEQARSGRPGMLLMLGEAGTGKSALLADVAERATCAGARVVMVDAVESDRALVGSGVSLLAARLRHVVALLAPEDVDVLDAAARAQVDGRLPGAVLSLLARTAEAGPVLLVLDDAQWWDEPSLQAVMFAVRRLTADPLACIVAGRPECDALAPLAHAPRLRLGGLSEADSVELVRRTAPDVVPEVARALAVLLEGNPLALLEVPPLLAARERAGAAPLPVPLPAGTGLRHRWGRLLDPVGPRCRQALGILAADESGSADVVGAALESAGLCEADLRPAEAAGVVRCGRHGWSFRHPLARSAAFAALTPAEQRSAHAALASALADGPLVARRAAHLARSVAGTDADAGEDLARAARALREAGSVAAAADAAAAAARALPVGARHEALLLDAARLSLAADDDVQAEELAREGLAVVDDAAGRARLEHVLGVAVGRRRPRDGLALLDHASSVLEGDERRAALVDALALLKMDNDPARCMAVVRNLGDPAELEPWMQLDAGIVLATAGDWERAAPLLDAGLLGVDAAAPGVSGSVLDAWVDASGVRGLEHGLDRYRCAAQVLHDSGAPARSAVGLGMLVELAHADGRWDEADGLNEEARDLARALGHEPLFALGTDLRLAARRGDVDRFEAAEPVLVRTAHDAGLDLLLGNCRGLRAVLLLGLGRVDEALALLTAVMEDAPPGMLPTTVFPSSAVSLVEVLVAADREAEAAAVASDVRPLLACQPAAISRSYAERLSALTARGPDAEAHHRAACALADEGLHAFEAARTRLAYGRWLRRRRRRADAVAVLVDAHAEFVRMRAGCWARQCERELVAAGLDVRRSDAYAAPTLTAQERRVAEVAAEGASNAEIARRLYLSPKTVELHLTHVYRKLGITGRRQLAAALDPVPAGSGAG